MEITAIKQGHPMWNKTMDFAADCSWKAGSSLASRMRKNDFKPWERVIVATDDAAIMGYCTLAERDELPDEYDYTPFIGYVFVDEKYRGNRVSEKMIEFACEYAKGTGCSKVFIMSGELGLYEKFGFRKIGDYRTVYGTTDQLFEKEL